jgi:hypothetical protein
MPFFVIYGAEAVLPTDIDYGAPRVMAYKEQEAKEFLEDAMDWLDEAHDVTLLHSARYQQVLRRYHSRRVRGQAFNVGDLVLCLSRATRTATSYLCHGKDHTPSWRCSDRAPTSSRGLMAKSSPMHGILSSYIASTPSFFPKLLTYL